MKAKNHILTFLKIDIQHKGNNAFVRGRFF